MSFKKNNFIDLLVLFTVNIKYRLNVQTYKCTISKRTFQKRKFNKKFKFGQDKHAL